MTSAQRARLVVALGLLNLVLATVALTAGLIAPSQPDRGVAAGTSPAPSELVPGTSSNPSASPANSPTTPVGSESAPPGSPSVPPSVEPSVEPSTSPAPSAPTVAQGPTPTPAASPIVVKTPAPTATPRSTATPRPTSQPTATPPTPPKPTPEPTARPTVPPTPAPTTAPVDGKVKNPRPPCPSAGGDPPGHNKGQEPMTRPCGGKGDHGNGGSGVVIVLPLALLGAAASGRRLLVAGAGRIHRLARRRSA